MSKIEQMTIGIDEDISEKVREIARRNGLTFEDVVNTLLRTYLEEVYQTNILDYAARRARD